MNMYQYYLITGIGKLGPSIIFFTATVFLCIFEISVLQNHYRTIRKSKGLSKAIIKDLWRDFMKIFKRNSPELEYSANLERLKDTDDSKVENKAEIIEEYTLEQKGPIVVRMDYFCGFNLSMRSLTACLIFIIFNTFSRFYDLLVLTINYSCKGIYDENINLSMIIWFSYTFIELIFTLLAFYGLMKNYARLQRWFILWRYIFSGKCI